MRAIFEGICAWILGPIAIYIGYKLYLLFLSVIYDIKILRNQALGINMLEEDCVNQEPNDE